jgi:hypothetical protein
MSGRQTREVLARAIASGRRRYHAIAGQLRVLRTQAQYAGGGTWSG